MGDHYTFVDGDNKVIDRIKYYRIKATRDFKNPYRDVNRGELGGYVTNLTEIESCGWVFGNALVNDCRVFRNSYIVGDFKYNRIDLYDSGIRGTGDYNGTFGYNKLVDLDVVGHNFIKGSKHFVVWGVDKDSKEIRISVGCQFYTLSRWKEIYQNIAKFQGYDKIIDEYLGYLKQIEDSLKPSNEKILEKISGNVEALKKNVTEELKSETISLVTSLKVPEKVLEKSGPKRCPKTGRWLKKNP